MAALGIGGESRTRGTSRLRSSSAAHRETVVVTPPEHGGPCQGTGSGPTRARRGQNSSYNLTVLPVLAAS
jgi:hypothetical protein